MSQPTPTKKMTPRRQMQGVVLRKSGDKTVSVEISHVAQHPLYHKRVTRRKRYLVHDADNSAKIGEVVTIAESRPLSTSKRWTIVKGK
jgi:small subunit ribosomal protein S17